MAKDNKAAEGAPKQAPNDQKQEAAKDQTGEQAKEQGTIASGYDGTRVLKKMSPKTVMGRIKRPSLGDPGDPTANPPKPAVPADPPKSLYVVLGQTSGIKTGDGDNGPWTAFVGHFQSIRSDTGDVAASALCFVPKAFEELLLGAVQRAQSAEGGDPNALVEFAIEVGIEPDEKSATGYIYWVKNLVKVQQGDPLAALRQTLIASGKVPQLKQLAAPAAS